MLAAAGDKGVVAIWESDEQVTHSLTHSLTYSLTYSLTQALIHDHFNSRIKEIPSVYDNVGESSDTPAAAGTTFPSHSLTHLLTHLLTYSLS